ncbi:MAG: hypothetical protein XU10_C0055G0002 [Chloroflexi bacterium CSP1-4]|nr:MAG: hypothetical protein XU10_C0055G0002 [Chloroflexi bacterium CSP1-4]
MRFLYLLTGIGLGIEVWPAMTFRTKPWDPLYGVADSFWAALSLLMLLGVRFPVKMLPLMLLQLFYKLTWLILVAYPLWTGGHWSPLASELFMACAIGAVLGLIVIPWPYVFENYIRAIFTREASAAGLRP